MYSDFDRMRDQATIRACEERWLNPDTDDYDDYDEDDDYPYEYDTSEEAYD